MRCIWSTTAHVLLRRTVYSRTLTTLRNHVPVADSGCSASDTSLPISNQNSNTESILKSFPYAENLSAAQLSRAAAQAVRLSISNRELKSGYFIVNSLRLSLLGKNDSVASIPGFQSQVERFDPIYFDKPVSPRLSAHTLLHGLIRLGLSVKAYQQADLMIQQGMRVRSVSMQAVVGALLTSSSSVAPTSTQRPPVNARLNHSDILRIRPNGISDPCTRHAVRLFLRAREYRQRRSQRTFQSLLNACLLQGEIIVGSLLFVMVVKDWQLRKTLSARFRSDRQDSATITSGSVNQSKLDLRARFDHLRSERIGPQGQTMLSILSSIDAALSQDPQESSHQTAFQASLQALANFAVLLDNRQLPFPQIAPLIRTLYSVPRVENEVWILNNRVPRRVKAHSYFHQVLEGLLDSFSQNQSNKPSLPPLDLHAYNALLHYTLRHRCSPTIAEEIMEHMRRKQWKALAPDIATYNILLRSGTLIRRQDVTDQTLEDLRQKMVKVDPQFAAASGVETNTNTKQELAHPVTSESQSSTILYTPEGDNVELPDGMLRADPFTLSTYITYLTSTGQPHVVAEVLFQVLPELAIIDHPSWGSLSDKERQQLRALSRQTCIQRAVAHGPYFFASVLNALRKAGKTGLAERVWHLAKEAERVSWIPEFMPESGPWCLPVHAYTTMIQCYAAEARAGLRSRRSFGRSLPVTDQMDWVPMSKRYVRGWAQFIVSRQKVTHSKVCRITAGRQMGIILFHSMKKGAHAVYRSLLTVKHLDKGRWRNVQVPSPDARFFNAALELSVPHLQRLDRSRRVSPTFWKRVLRRATLRYAQSGATPRGWNPMLQDIAEEMVNAGFSVPPALRYLLVGRQPSGTQRQSVRRPLDRQPYFFAPLRSNSYQLHRIPTVNNRGWAYRSKSQRRRRRRRLRRFKTMSFADRSNVALASSQ